MRRGVDFASPQAAAASGSGGADISVRILNSAPVVVAHGVLTSLPWDTESYDTSAFHDVILNNNLIIFPSNGKYLVWSQVVWAASGVVNSMYASIIYKNSVTELGRQACSQGVSALGAENSLIIEAEFVAGDYVETLVYQDSTFAQTVGFAGFPESVSFGARKVDKAG